MTPDMMISAGAGMALSLFFGYFPRVEATWKKLPGEVQARWMLVMIFFTSLASFLATCFGFNVLPGITCDQAGVAELFKAFFAALVGNQGMYQVGVRPFNKPPEAAGGSSFGSTAPPTVSGTTNYPINPQGNP